MKKIISFFVSFYFWISLFLISALLFPVALVIFLFTFLFDKKRKIHYYFTCAWSWITIAINPYWKIRIRGRHNIKSGQNYIMVANHSSGADILVLYQLFRPFKWVAKQSLFYTPFLGWNMWLNGSIPIVRTKGRSKLEMMDKAANAVLLGNSVMIFPEGTRTQTGKIQNFKTGSFRLALKTETPILPIAIHGTFHAIKKGGLTIHKNKNIRAYVLDPLPYEAFKDKEPKEIAIIVHDLIGLHLDSLNPVVK